MSDLTPNLNGTLRSGEFTDWPEFRILEELFDIPNEGETVYLLTRMVIPYMGTTLNQNYHD